MTLPGVVAARPWGMTASGLALVAVCYGLARFAYGLFLPAFQDTFYLSATMSGVIAGGSFAGYCVTVLASALAVGRFGPRAVAVAAGVLATAGMAVVAGAVNTAMLAMGVLAAGASTGVASPPLAEAVKRWGPGSHHDRAQAFVNAGPAVGIMVSGPVALLALGNWRAAWACFALIAAAVTCWILASVPSKPALWATGGRQAQGLARIVATRRSWPVMGAALVFGAASSAVWSFGRDRVVEAGALNPTASVLLWTVLGAAELAGLAAGDLIARYGLARVWTGALAVLAAATGGLGLLPGQAGLAFVGVACFGAAYVTLTTVIFFWATRMYPSAIPSAVALGFLMISAGQALASPVVGALADHVSAAFAFIICAVLGVLGALTLKPRAHP